VESALDGATPSHESLTRVAGEATTELTALAAAIRNHGGALRAHVVLGALATQVLHERDTTQALAATHEVSSGSYAWLGQLRMYADPEGPERAGIITARACASRRVLLCDAAAALLTPVPVTEPTHAPRVQKGGQAKGRERRQVSSVALPCSGCAERAFFCRLITWNWAPGWREMHQRVTYVWLLLRVL
jgi:hypothetical protein